MIHCMEVFCELLEVDSNIEVWCRSLKHCKHFDPMALEHSFRTEGQDKALVRFDFLDIACKLLKYFVAFSLLHLTLKLEVVLGKLRHSFYDGFSVLFSEVVDVPVLFEVQEVVPVLPNNLSALELLLESLDLRNFCGLDTQSGLEGAVLVEFLLDLVEPIFQLLQLVQCLLVWSLLAHQRFRLNFVNQLNKLLLLANYDLSQLHSVVLLLGCGSFLGLLDDALDVN